MIDQLRKVQPATLVVGNHPKIIQSVLDFDYAAGRSQPSVVGIVSAGRKAQKMFWGDGEVLLPVLGSVAEAVHLGRRPNMLLCCTSASTAPETVDEFFATFPRALAAHIFAENVAERDALRLAERFGNRVLVAGPSGVGLCVPGSLKLGAIGGLGGERVASLGSSRGKTAVVTSSGGMVNELIHQITLAGGGVSFAVSYGGERFPVTSPLRWVLEAERDPATSQVVYFGELGGHDEYDIAQAIRQRKVTKPLHVYIAGHANLGSQPLQFGHAKALARRPEETASAKLAALRAAGAKTYDTFEKFMAALAALPGKSTPTRGSRSWRGRPANARPSLVSAPVHGDDGGSYVERILCRILGRAEVSPQLAELADRTFSLLVDHGPHVSGAVNAIVTARAGRDMSSALAAGVLTVGDRFGGAINEAAATWASAVANGTSPEALVRMASASRQHIPGIGHLRYSAHRPDPRVAALLALGAQNLKLGRHAALAVAVGRLTSAKKPNLVLNVDGAVAALFLDYLTELEGFTGRQIEELVAAEFFNSLFLIPRSVGFIGHFLDQRRNDEGLLRLSDSDVLEYR